MAGGSFPSGGFYGLSYLVTRLVALAGRLVSIRSTISPTCSPALPTTRRGASPNSCPGTGNRSKPPAPPLELARSPNAYEVSRLLDREDAGAPSVPSASCCCITTLLDDSGHGRVIG